MSDVALSVAFAGPLVTIQDGGRPGNMRFGVSASGAMDRLAFDAGNAALGNSAGQTGIEVSLGGLALTCTQGAITIAITGGDFIVEHAGQEFGSWVVLTLRKGERLAIRGGTSGSWAYLTFAGELQSNAWLGSQATHAPSGFGGGKVHSGQRLHLTDASLRNDRIGDIPKPDFIPKGPIRAVMGPQDHHFTAEAHACFNNDTFKVSNAYDRMGMRLTGAKLNLNGALSIPSEPIVRGAVQVSGDGVPTILLADHQTVGGYPKIANVVSADIDRLTQHRAGDILRFETISSETAIDEARKYKHQKAAFLSHILIPRGSLAQRLMRENLIHGCVYE